MEQLTFLEQNKPLSESIIWKMLEDYYHNASISAWNQIPFYPTSNPFIAETYAEMILAFLKDYAKHIHTEEPLYIVELAAGSGCFSFYLIKELLRKQKYFSELSNMRVKYVMTDFTENNVKSWEQNNKLQPFIKSGFLDFAVFRPETDDSILLRQAMTTLKAGCSQNPVITIANYFFDSIRQDAFQIQAGQFKEVLHSFYYQNDKPEAQGNIDFDRLLKLESYIEAPLDFYSDPELNAVLYQYKNEYTDASILFPRGAFDCIKNMRKISNDKLVLLSSDKGFTDKAYIQGQREQPFLAHHGVFSYSVNYDAIKKYFENKSGLSFNTSDDSLSISSSLNFMLPETDCKFEASTYYFQEKTDKQNLSNYLYFLQDILTEIPPGKSNEILRACLAYIQLCNFDPIIFCLAAPRIYAALDTITNAQEDRVYQIINKVRENFYSVQQQFDVFYWIGRIYYGLNQVDSALNEFLVSIDVFGMNSSSLYYIAACYEIKKEFDKALQIYTSTLEIEPGCEFTQAGIQRINKILEQTR